MKLKMFTGYQQNFNTDKTKKFQQNWTIFKLNIAKYENILSHELLVGIIFINV